MWMTAVRWPVLTVRVVAVGVVVDQDRRDRLGSSLAGLHVGGEDLVAGFEAGDGHGEPAGEKHLGARGKAHPAASRRGVGQAGVFCGEDGIRKGRGQPLSSPQQLCQYLFYSSSARKAVLGQGG